MKAIMRIEMPEHGCRDCKVRREQDNYMMCPVLGIKIDEYVYKETRPMVCPIEPYSKGDNTNIAELGLTVRTHNALIRAGINTIGEITSMDDDRLKRVRGLGNKGYQEIKDKLNTR